MLCFLFCVVIKLFIDGIDCYIFETDFKGTNENVDQILQRYMKPIQRLTEKFPNHNVEVELEMAPADPPTIPREQVLAIANAYALGSVSTPSIINWPEGNSAALHGLRTLSREILNFRRAGKPREAKDPPAAPSEAKDTRAALSGSSSVAPVSTPKKTENMPKEAMPEAEGTNMKPIYLEDLKKAMEEFEKKIEAIKKAKDAHAAHAAETLEDGKKPLLKKDLWIALGLKQANGCTENKLKETYEPSKTITQKTKATSPKSKPTKTSVETLNPNLEKIIALLKKGVKVQKHMPKNGAENMQWLKVKIPKQFL